jgi:hypothetical protein
MRQILHDLELAMYRCSVSIKKLESALAPELSNADAVRRTGYQLALTICVSGLSCID